MPRAQCRHAAQRPSTHATVVADIFLVEGIGGEKCPLGGGDCPVCSLVGIQEPTTGQNQNKPEPSPNQSVDVSQMGREEQVPIIAKKMGNMAIHTVWQWGLPVGRNGGVGWYGKWGWGEGGGGRTAWGQYNVQNCPGTWGGNNVGSPLLTGNANFSFLPLG